MDTLSGVAFYEDPGVHQRYLTARAVTDEPNRTMEEPHVLRFLGDVGQHDILDLGCGNAAIGPVLLAAGARSYVGVDGSRRMVDMATRQLAGGAGTVHHRDLENWTPDGSRFDTVLSRMALHYVEDLDRLLAAVRQACRDGGQLVFSVEHPVVTSSYDGDRDGFVSRTWTVRDYHRQGPRSCAWLESRVYKHHRTFETYVRLLTDNGFTLCALAEGEPVLAAFTDRRSHGRFLNVPMYAIFHARVCS